MCSVSRGSSGREKWSVTAALGDFGAVGNLVSPNVGVQRSPRKYICHLEAESSASCCRVCGARPGPVLLGQTSKLFRVSHAPGGPRHRSQAGGSAQKTLPLLFFLFCFFRGGTPWLTSQFARILSANHPLFFIFYAYGTCSS